MNGDDEPRIRHQSPTRDQSAYEDGPLAHIFPFQRAQTPPLPGRPKMKKKVSMDTRSMSSSSARSHHSRTTLDSRVSAIEGDVSIEKLTMTQGPDGESVLMMAIEGKQDRALQYLLSLTEYYTPSHVFEDYNNEGTNLLSAAIQLGHAKTTDTILNYILENSPSPEALREYLAKPDVLPSIPTEMAYRFDELRDDLELAVGGSPALFLEVHHNSCKQEIDGLR